CFLTDGHSSPMIFRAGSERRLDGPAPVEQRPAAVIAVPGAEVIPRRSAGVAAILRMRKRRRDRVAAEHLQEILWVVITRVIPARHIARRHLVIERDIHLFPDVPGLEVGITLPQD